MKIFQNRVEASSDHPALSVAAETSWTTNRNHYHSDYPGKFEGLTFGLHFGVLPRALLFLRFEAPLFFCTSGSPAGGSSRDL